ncbi:ras-related protein Rab-7a isoform X2 [Cyclopterus lumpus]|uniref:ras-related protein Rab-7a isoform X2 n=1 Tax=Cyclopterus lumpus TaxID=8103 RepID=UPI0014871853|nr:ras-related protein Rab-7a isoform X2 [Cyclopterus lumpus]
MNDRKSPLTLKIILIGSSGVGKSSFMNRYVNHRFTKMYRATVGTDFLSKTINVDGDAVTLQIWDTAGTERFQSLGTPLYRAAHCCMLVFDVTSAASFSALEQWRMEFLVQGEPQDPQHFPFIVLGNKTDLSTREVSRCRPAGPCSGAWRWAPSTSKGARETAWTWRGRSWQPLAAPCNSTKNTHWKIQDISR